MSNKKTSFMFIITTLFIYPLPQAAIDLYLPSLPAMTKWFHTSHAIMQISLTLYITSLGIAQLVYGPLSDRYGRKPILLSGLFIFILGTTVCYIAPNWQILLLGRIIQGAGAGSGFSVASAILGDVFSGKKLAMMTTFSAIIYSLAPILAPVLGGYLQIHYGWTANFLTMLIFAIILIAGIYIFTEETNKYTGKSSLDPIMICSNYIRMLSNMKFLFNILSLTLAYGIMISFNIIGPFLLENTLGISPALYGKLLLFIDLAYLLGTSLNSLLLRYFKINTLIITGSILMVLFSSGLIFAENLNWFSIYSVTLFVSMAVFSTGLIFPNCFANALEIFPEKLGSASALIGSTGLIGTSIISIIATRISTSTEISLGWFLLLQSVLCLCLYLTILAKRNVRHS